MLKSKDAKLQGLRVCLWLPAAEGGSFLFPGVLRRIDLMTVQRLFLSLEISEKQLQQLQTSSGISIHEAAWFLSRIREYHEGVFHHSCNVAWLSAQLAIKLGLTITEVYLQTLGALFHDIGKIAIPCSILDKQSRLNEQEWALVKKHPKTGIALIGDYEWARQLEPMIMLHHERFDGQGYYSVPVEKLPLSVRIIIIADAFDAMKSPRPYQKKRSTSACWDEIERCSGTQFDPELLPAFYSTISKIPGKD